MRRVIASILLLSSAGFAPKKDGKTVTIGKGGLNPASVSIKPSESVTWTNGDDRDHQLVATDKSFDSSTIKPGDSYSFTFKSAGKVSYRCKLHPREKGTISVSE